MFPFSKVYFLHHLVSEGQSQVASKGIFESSSRWSSKVFRSLYKNKFLMSLCDAHVRCEMSNEVLQVPYVPPLYSPLGHPYLFILCSVPDSLRSYSSHAPHALSCSRAPTTLSQRSRGSHYAPQALPHSQSSQQCSMGIGNHISLLWFLGSSSSQAPRSSPHPKSQFLCSSTSYTFVVNASKTCFTSLSLRTLKSTLISNQFLKQISTCISFEMLFLKEIMFFNHPHTIYNNHTLSKLCFLPHCRLQIPIDCLASTHVDSNIYKISTQHDSP